MRLRRDLRERDCYGLRRVLPKSTLCGLDPPVAHDVTVLADGALKAAVNVK